MTKIQSSYKIIKSINVDSEDERSVILTKINSNSTKAFISEHPSETFVEDENSHTEDIENIREEIYKQVHQEAEAESAKIIEMIMTEAEDIKAQAKAQGQEMGIKQGYEQGYKQGYEEGLQSGLIEAKNESIEIKNNAISMIEQAEKNIDEYFKYNKANIIKLAAEMAESIVHTKIDTSSDNILMIINPILQQYGKKGNITISCHPNNILYLKENLYKLEANYPDSKFILFEDGNLEKNGCIVENKTQIIDLQIKKQLDSIFEDIKDV